MKNGKRIISIFLSAILILLVVLVVPVVHAEAPEFDYSSMGAADGTGSADDLSAGGTQGGIIQFGAYPKTREIDSETITALDSRASGWHSYRYYSGTGSWSDGNMTAKDYMMYCDVKYGSSKYRGVKFDTYRPFLTCYASPSNYQQENGYTTGTIYWFKYEPLQWKVLDSSEGLVMCVSLIDSQAYNNYILSSGTDPHNFTAFWGDAEKKHYANDYSNSSLREWLNETFFATAFTENQQNRIAKNHNHQNNDGYYTLTGNTNYTDYDSDPTNDKIFLLSYDEVRNSSYGFSSDATRQAQGTDYAKCQGLWVESAGSNQGNSWWWERSPGPTSDDACDIGSTGDAGDITGVHRTYLGVRPACVISNLSSGETEPEYDNTPHFPDGYAFERDSYSFGNYVERISKSYFTTLYEPAPGKALYQFEKDAYKEGMCFGLACTTSSILQGFPSIDNCYEIGPSGKNYTCIREMDRYLGYVYLANDNSIPLADYMKYAHIYQWSTNEYNAQVTTWNISASDLWSFIKEQIDNDRLNVMITMVRYYPDENGVLQEDENNELIKTSHTVLAVGYDDNSIFIDDSNNRENKQTITFQDDGSWSFSNPWETEGINSDNTVLFYSTRTADPYTYLSTGTHATVREGIPDINSGSIVKETFINGINRVDSSNLLLTFTAPDISVDGEIVAEISKYGSGILIPEDSSSSSSAYWLKDDNALTIQTNSKNELCIAKDNTLITTELENPSTVSVQAQQTVITASKNDKIRIGIENVYEYDNSGFFVEGYVDSGTVTATQTDSGIAVTGLDNLTITYGENDEVVAEIAANVTDGREITICVNDDNDTIEAVHEHDYTVTTTESTCTKEGQIVSVCSICGNTETEIIKKKAHMPAAAVAESKVDATCEKGGSYDSVVKCQDCKTELSRETITIPALGHTDADNDGHCDRCGEQMTGGDYCAYCGKIHDGFFGWLVRFFHKIFALFKR